MTDSFDDPKPKFKLPKWSIISAVILAVVVGIALAIPQFLDQAKYKDLIVTKVKEASGYDIKWHGDIGVSLLPLPSASIAQVELSKQGQKILSLKQADISVALWPLLQKKIEISNVKLDTPDIYLVVDENGKPSWTPDSKPTTSATGNESASAPQDSAPALVVQDVTIKNGKFTYKDLSKKSEQIISDIDTRLSLDSLQGPFKGKGSLIYNKIKIEFDSDVKKLEPGNAVPINAQVKLPDLKIDSRFKGNIQTGGVVRADGDFAIQVDNLETSIGSLTGKPFILPEGLNKNFLLNGKLAYEAPAIGLNDINIEVGQLAYQGKIKVNPDQSLNINLSSAKPDNSSSAPLIKILSNLDVQGIGKIENGTTVIESGKITLDGNQINIAGRISPAKQSGKPNLDLKVSAERLNIDDLTQKLGKVTESAAQKAADAKTSQKQFQQNLQGVSIPFDGRLNAQIGSLVLSGKTYNNLITDILSKGNALNINNFSTLLVADSKLDVKGTIGNLSELSGLNLNVNAETGNLEALLKAFNAPPLKTPQAIGAARLNGNFKGSLKSLDFSSTLNALGFSLTGAGNLQSVLQNPIINQLNFNVKHASLENAVGTFQKGFQAPQSFKGPLNISSNIVWQDKKYQLANIKGNLGATSLNGNLSIAVTEKPMVTGALNFGDLKFSPHVNGGSVSGSAKGSSSGVSKSSGARWSREAINLTWMNNFNADLNIKAQSITQNLWRLNNANLNFKLSGGVLDVRDMSANLFGGNINMTGQVKAGVNAQSPLSLNWTAKANTIDARQLQSALTSKSSDTISGTIQSFDVTVNSTGISPSALVNGLNGKGAMIGKNLIVKGVDAAKLAEAARGSFKPLERAGSLYNTFQSGQTSFSDFNSDFTIQNGVVNFNQIKFDGAEASIDSVGNVNLPLWTIALKNKMTVKNTDIPPFEFEIKGPLDSPLQTGGSVIENYLRQKAQKKIEKFIGNEIEKRFGVKGLGGLLGGGQPAPEEGQEAPQSQPRQQQPIIKPEDAVKALEGLFGR